MDHTDVTRVNEDDHSPNRKTGKLHMLRFTESISRNDHGFFILSFLIRDPYC